MANVISRFCRFCRLSFYGRLRQKTSEGIADSEVEGLGVLELGDIVVA